MRAPAVQSKTRRTGRFVMGERHRRLIGTAIGALAIAVLGIAFLAEEVFAAPSITLTPNHGRGGTHVTVDGSGFPGSGTFGVAVYVYWDWGDATQLLVANSTTSFTGTFSIPFDVPVGHGHFGANTVRACVPTTDGVTACHATDTTPFADATFTIPRPNLSVKPGKGRPGMSSSATGVNFFPGGIFHLTWDPGGSATDIGSGTTDKSGGITLGFSVPKVAPGTYTVRGCTIARAGTCLQNDTAKTAFVVTSPTLSANPAHGMTGDKIATSGKNYWPRCPLQLFLGPTSNPTQTELTPGTGKTTDTGGAFGYSVPVPNVPAGAYLITARTNRVSTDICPVGDIVSRSFTVDATPTPTPSPSLTPSPTPTPRPTAKPTATPVPQPTATSGHTAPPTARPTAAPTAAPAGSPTSLPSETASLPVESPSPSATLAETPTALPAATPPPTETVPPATSTASPATPIAAPTPAPTPSPIPVPPPINTGTWPDSVRGPTDVPFDPGVAGGGLLLSLLIAFLVPFPGALFNKTVEANQEEITGWFESGKRRWRGLVGLVAVGPLGGAVDRLGRSLGGGLLGVWVFLGLSAFVYGFLNPSFGLDSQSLAMFLGLLIGLAFITAAFDLPLRVYHRRATGELGRLRALWWTLAVAIFCVLISRLVGFQPGYLYGLVVTIAFTTVVSVRNEGIGVWLASAWLLGLSVGAWLLLEFTRSLGGDPWVLLLLQTVLATFVVAGIEALAIGLLPMRFLPGHPLFEWSRLAWFPIFVASVFAYVMILIDPRNGYLSSSSQTPTIIGIVFLVAFGIVSVGTWAYFRYRPERGDDEEPDRPGEAPDEDEGAPALGSEADAEA